MANTPLPGVDLPMELRNNAHRALIGFWWTSLLVRKVSRRFFRRRSTSEAKFNVLMALKYAEKELTQQELSDRVMVDKSNVTVLLDSLESRGLIQRNKVPDDRRSHHVALTAAGRSRADALDEEYTAVVRRVMSAFSDAEQTELARLMRKMRVSLLEGVA